MTTVASGKSCSKLRMLRMAAGRPDGLRGEEDAGGHLLEVVGDEGGELARPLELALGTGDGGEHGAWGDALRVQRQVLHRPLDGRDLVGVVVDREGARDADLLAVDAEGAGADGVERAHRNVAAALLAHERE